MTPKSLAFTVIDNLFVAVYGATAPTDADWKSYLDEIKRQGIEHTVHLLVTDGSGPTDIQRRTLEHLVAGHEVPVAVVSESAWVRTWVVTMSWFNLRLRAFNPLELRAALSFLEIPVSRAELIDREIELLRRSLARGGKT